MMGNNTINRINTVGKVASIITLIAKIILIIAFVAMIISGISMLFVPDDFLSVNMNGSADIVIDKTELPGIILSDIEDDILIEDEDFKFGGISFKVDNIENNEDETALSVSGEITEVDGRKIAAIISIAFLVGAIYIAFVFFILIFVHKLAKALAECHSPFEENVIKRMKHFGFSMIPWAIVSCFKGGYMSTFAGAGLFKINIDLTVVLLVAAVIMLIYIFDFGAQLQRESDETL